MSVLVSGGSVVSDFGHWTLVCVTKILRKFRAQLKKGISPIYEPGPRRN